MTFLKQPTSFYAFDARQVLVSVSNFDVDALRNDPTVHLRLSDSVPLPSRALLFSEYFFGLFISVNDSSSASSDSAFIILFQHGYEASLALANVCRKDIWR